MEGTEVSSAFSEAFPNLLTAMMKSLWSLKVMRGSERHLGGTESTVGVSLPRDTALLNGASSPCESLAGLNGPTYAGREVLF